MVANSAILRKWKWQFVSGCECKSLITAITEFLNSFLPSGTSWIVLYQAFWRKDNFSLPVFKFNRLVTYAMLCWLHCEPSIWEVFIPLHGPIQKVNSTQVLYALSVFLVLFIVTAFSASAFFTIPVACYKGIMNPKIELLLCCVLFGHCMTRSILRQLWTLMLAVVQLVRPHFQSEASSNDEVNAD